MRTGARYARARVNMSDNAHALSQAKPSSRTREMLFYILLYPAWADLLRQGKLWGVGHAYSLMVW